MVQQPREAPQGNCKPRDVATSPIRPAPVEEVESSEKQQDVCTTNKEVNNNDKTPDLDPIKCRECKGGGGVKSGWDVRIVTIGSTCRAWGFVW